jgi:N,N'-diacetyllegionaminate synthase
MFDHSLPLWERHACGQPYVIAEAGVNHNGRVDMACQLIDAAKSAGADCVKFQAYTACELVTRDAEKAEYQKRCGSHGESQYDMLCRYELSEDEFVRLYYYAQEVGIDFLATPFSASWVTRLQKIGVGAVKIGSGNLNMLQLLQQIGRSGLEVILSTGMADLGEIRSVVQTLVNGGSEKIALLHCVSLYPTPLEQVNLYAMKVLRDEFNLPVGFSDHTERISTGGLAVAAGAVILEKHFTLDQSLEGPDHAMSLTPGELKSYIDFSREAAVICGERIKRPQRGEAAIKNAVRTSLVARRTIKTGAIITAEMLTEKRPGNGIASDQLEQVIGAVARQEIHKNDVLQDSLITMGERVAL